MQTLDVGEVAPIATTWWDADGDPAEPSAIDLTITNPNGTVLSLTKADMDGSESVAGSGVDDVWTYLLVCDTAGLWRVTALGTVNDSPVTQSSTLLVGAGGQPGPCEPWATWEEVVACTTADLDALDSAARESAIDQASAILFDLTGRVYPGICETTRSLCYGCARCYPSCCSCEPVHGIDLGPAWPVWGAWDVVVDGETLGVDAYRVIDRRWLTRIDGQSWPSGADVEEADSFRATWAYGRAVPPGGRKAAATFAAQIALACSGRACELPQRVTQVQREGVSYTILDSMNMIQEGRTGLPMVDLWVVADAKGRRAKPHLFAPALAGGRKVRP